MFYSIYFFLFSQFSTVSFFKEIISYKIEKQKELEKDLYKTDLLNTNVYDRFYTEYSLHTNDSVYKERFNYINKIETTFDLSYKTFLRNYINIYLVHNRNLSERILNNMNFYFPIFEKKLKENGLPSELKYLPIIESALKPKVLSKAGAGGLWQFMPNTAKYYGLVINEFVDERFDPEKSTDAACKYLKHLYKQFNDWNLVLAAYNSGPTRVRKIMKQMGNKNAGYWNIYKNLPTETRSYVPIFHAAIYLCYFYKHHGFEIKENKLNYSHITLVEVDKTISLSEIANKIGLDESFLKSINTQYKKEIVLVTPGKKKYINLPYYYVKHFNYTIRSEEKNTFEDFVNLSFKSQEYQTLNIPLKF